MSGPHKSRKEIVLNWLHEKLNRQFLKRSEAMLAGLFSFRQEVTDDREE